MAAEGEEIAVERSTALSAGGGGGGGDAPPSRSELLSMVKKHSHLIGWTVVDEQDDSDMGMDAKFWHEMLDLYFVRGRVSNGREEDDLVFFVSNTSLHGYGFNDNMEEVPPFFVRRWAPTLEKVIGANSVEVDWERSFYLNLIAHTSFTVTVAICSIEALRSHGGEKNKSLSPIYKVKKTVYASPSRVDFHLDHKKAVETVPAYPNICFAVDDFDDTFDTVVLSDPDHCYCVILNAHDGAAFPEENEMVDYNSSIQSSSNSESNQEQPPKRTLFSGYVSYQNVREAYDAGKSKFGSFLSLGHDQTKSDRLYMRGPEGRGEVEVAVSGIADQSREKTSISSFRSSKKCSGVSFAAIVHRAAAAASDLAKHAYEAASTNRRLDDELLPLNCSLMSISLPWEYVAHDLLLKETPPLNL